MDFKTVKFAYTTGNDNVLAKIVAGQERPYNRAQTRIESTVRKVSGQGKTGVEAYKSLVNQQLGFLRVRLLYAGE